VRRRIAHFTFRRNFRASIRCLARRSLRERGRESTAVGCEPSIATADSGNTLAKAGASSSAASSGNRPLLSLRGI
jgi:hypothetical protein